MSLSRFFKHSFISPWSVKKYFPAKSMERITAVISDSEKRHDAEIVFAIEPSIPPFAALKGYSARERSIDVFSNLRVWDTEANNGVMIYLLLADHDIEIVADRGVNRLAGAEYWEDVCHKMEERFRKGEFLEGVIEGIETITKLLEVHYPKTKGNANELPNKPVIV
ncbi:MAG: TPM domain-containing protein [Leptospira sp.]|nr:TPM domain-containing protein [Leptospira sp.]